ncbi:hypothetical protein PsYK624_129260 [Phanerochaete sordida]|uniref:Uncharacterized protein n=1 Tax=Phanerochaete sordida TaxID=48140 RepID=A0A9P3GNL3_9APHY|nr:hypothetical protein PsYK624_129260 [Phanerochaete sordida]
MLPASDKVETQGRVPALTRAAAAVAASTACGSVRARPTRESDEAGDEGFWIGAADGAHGRGGAREALRALQAAAGRVHGDPEAALPASLARSPDTPQAQRAPAGLAGARGSQAARCKARACAACSSGVGTPSGWG